MNNRGEVRRARWAAVVVLRAAVVAVAALVAACGAGSGAGGRIGEVMMPPDEFIRPFDGKVTVMNLPHKPGSPVLSLSHHAAGRCAIWLPRIGDPDITRTLYECLAIIEIANCNGATDINTPAVKARTAHPEQARYARPCTGRDWGWAFNAVRTVTVAAQTATTGAPLPASLF